ncbi:MAG: lysophospholipid acyltransferase family protein [Bacteroidota bacterium]
MRYVEYFLFVLLGAIVRLFPLRLAQRIGETLGTLMYHVISVRRVVALENLRRAFPEKSEREVQAIAKGAFRNFAIAMVELLWFPRLTRERIEKLVRFKNLDLMMDAHKQGKGVIMMSGHFGNWELIALSAALQSNLPLTIIVKTQHNRLIDGLLNRYRCLHGNRTVPMGISVREIFSALQEKRVVAMVADQSGPRGGLFVDFFGRPTATHQGPALFSLKTGAPVQMGFLVRQMDGTYEGVFEEVSKEELSEVTEANIAELTRRHTKLLEKYVRMYPDHWLWMHRRWKHSEHSGQARAVPIP